MTKKLLLSVSTALMLAACQGAEDTASKSKDAASKMAEVTLPAGVSKVETVTKKGDEVVIPYKKYTLDNGLTVVTEQLTPTAQITSKQCRLINLKKCFGSKPTAWAIS